MASSVVTAESRRPRAKIVSTRWLDHRDSNLLETRPASRSANSKPTKSAKTIAPPQRERGIVIGESREVIAGACHGPGASCASSSKRQASMDCRRYSRT